MCVCVRERERKKGSKSERECVWVSGVWVSERESIRESVFKRERERKKERERE